MPNHVLLFCVHRLVLCLFPVMSVARVVDHGSSNRTVVCSLQQLCHAHIPEKLVSS